MKVNIVKQNDFKSPWSSRRSIKRLKLKEMLQAIKRQKWKFIEFYI